MIADVGIALSAVGPDDRPPVPRRGAPEGPGARPRSCSPRPAKIASEDCSPGADGRGPVDYKRHLAGVLTQRALRRATSRALQEV